MESQWLGNPQAALGPASHFPRAADVSAELARRRKEGDKKGVALGYWTKGKKEVIFRLRKGLLVFVPAVFKATHPFSFFVLLRLH